MTDEMTGGAPDIFRQMLRPARALIGTDETAHGVYRARCSLCGELYPVTEEFLFSLAALDRQPVIECITCNGFTSTTAEGVAREAHARGRLAIGDLDVQVAREHVAREQVIRRRPNG